MAQGKLSEAEPLLREALEKTPARAGRGASGHAGSINNLGILLQAQGKLSEAEPYLREALEKSRHLLGEENPHTLTSINNLGTLLQDQGKLDEAEPLLREALERRRRVLGDDHPDTLNIDQNLSDSVDGAGQAVRGRAATEGVPRPRTEQLAADDPGWRIPAPALGRCLIQQKKWVEAEPVLREALAIRAAKQPGDWSTTTRRACSAAALPVRASTTRPIRC